MEVDLRRLLRQAPARADRHRRTARAVGSKLAVVGNTGSGKTLLARKLATELGVPHVDLDALFWRPGWAMAPTDEFRRAVDGVLGEEGWVVDGNYFGRLGERVLARADLVVWLDPPLPTIGTARAKDAREDPIKRGALGNESREPSRGLLQPPVAPPLGAQDALPQAPRACSNDHQVPARAPPEQTRNGGVAAALLGRRYNGLSDG